eukprot:767897-Hanusia_phi.AAC.4
MVEDDVGARGAGRNHKEEMIAISAESLTRNVDQVTTEGNRRFNKKWRRRRRRSEKTIKTTTTTMMMTVITMITTIVNNVKINTSWSYGDNSNMNISTSLCEDGYDDQMDSDDKVRIR